jgi:hypothetical protein
MKVENNSQNKKQKTGTFKQLQKSSQKVLPLYTV